MSTVAARLPATQKSPTRTLAQANRRLRWTMLVPALIFVGAMIVFPIVYTVNLSFTDAFGAVNAPKSYVGPRNFADALTDVRRFWPAVARTAYFTVIAVAVEAVLGLALAMLMRKAFRGNRLVRTILIIPLLTTPVAIGILWLLILDPTNGIANHLLAAIGLPRLEFLGSAGQSLPTLMFIDVWQWTEEAARVDGLSPFGAFWRIALPLAVPGTATASLLAFIASWNNFMFALIFSDSTTQTVPVALFKFISYASTDWGGLMAAATGITVPVVIVAAVGQRYIVAGLTAGATKG